MIKIIIAGLVASSMLGGATAAVAHPMHRPMRHHHRMMHRHHMMHGHHRHHR